MALTEVRKRLTELGFGSFSIVDQLEQFRTVFLIIDSVLGLLGGISLLVASFGIANTMIMSILERTREIGIMKAIGAEDREIKLIFFVEAAVLGLAGGVIGVFWRLGNRRDGKPSCLSIHSETAGRVVRRLLLVAAVALGRRDPVCAGRFDSRRTLSGRARRAHRSGAGADGMIRRGLGYRRQDCRPARDSLGYEAREDVETMSAELKINLPDGLAREAEANGLLTSESIESLLREELKRRRVSGLFAAAERLANLNTPPLTEAEVEAEILAARHSRHAPDESRS